MIERTSLLYQVMQHVVTLFGVGFLPKAPGTYASLLTVFFVWFIPENLSLLLLTGVLWLGFFGTWRYLEANPQKDDPSEVVIDEVVGQWIVLLFVPHHMLWFLFGFILFRLFDIWKPFPISWVDAFGKKTSNSWKKTCSVILDDVVAGGIAACVLLLFL